MQKYIVLEHTADIMIKAYGHSLDEMFVNAAIGMCEQVTEMNEFRVQMFHQYSFEIEEKVEDEEYLLREFLSEIKDRLYDRYYPYKIDIHRANGKLEVLVTCFQLTERSTFSDEIKAVTYHEMKIKKEAIIKIHELIGKPKGPSHVWHTKVVFDV